MIFFAFRLAPALRLLYRMVKRRSGARSNGTVRLALYRMVKRRSGARSKGKEGFKSVNMEKRRQRNAYQVVEHCLTDFLEIHFSQNPKSNSEFVHQLVGRSARPPELSALSCAALGDALLIARNGHPGNVKRLYLLDAHEKSVACYELKLTE